MSDVDASPVLPLFDIQRALSERARRTQEIAQEIVFRKLRGIVDGEQIRAQLEIDEHWWTAAEALIFDAQQAVIEEMAACSPAVERRTGKRTFLDWPMGRMLTHMRDIMALRVQHANQYLTVRALDDSLTLAQTREAMGVDEKSFRVARAWLQEAGLQIKEDTDGVFESNGRPGGRA